MTSPCCYENFEGDKTDFRGGSVPDMKLLSLSLAKFARDNQCSCFSKIIIKILCLIKEKKDVKNTF